MLAAYHGHSNLVRFLIQRGADPNRLNDRQQSPLAGAVFKKEDDVIEVSCDPLVQFASGLGLEGHFAAATNSSNRMTMIKIKWMIKGLNKKLIAVLTS